MSSPANILVLGCYPAITPRHGGQVRLHEIIAAYRTAGQRVLALNLYEYQSYEDQPRGEQDIDYPADHPSRRWAGANVPLIVDLTSGQYAAEDEAVYRRLTQIVQRFGAPRLIHLEQPWLLPLVQRWRQEGCFPEARLVYGSQNLEAPLKRTILEHYGIPQAAAIAAAIEQLESQACAQADVILAVSGSDQQALAQRAGKPVVLAANGISARTPSPEALAYWRQRLPSTPFALFVGSAHPPNISGFFESLGSSLGFLAPDQRIVVLGSVGPHLPAQPPFQRWGPLNASRLQILGQVDEEALAAIKALAHTFILPITEGGGSNIKTAEALQAGKYVLGTPTAFRGFHAYLDLPGVQMIEPGAAFGRQLAALLRRPPLPASAAQEPGRQTLLWSHTLQPMLAAVRPFLSPNP